MPGFRFRLAVVAAKLGAKLIRLTGRNASHTPGVIALKICPNFMSEAPRAPLVICVTGTNGKTTVANLLTDALHADGKRAVSNRTGSNIVPGCVTNLLNSVDLLGRCRVDATVFEVDERASRLILPFIKPDYLVVTNLFRDSLKRNAHPDYIFSVIDTYCPDSTKLILNADELCCARLKPQSEHVFYGIGKQDTDLTASINIVSDYSVCPTCGADLSYDYLRYHHIGHARCDACGFESPHADVMATVVDAQNRTLTVRHEGRDLVFPLISPITFNIYNELTVITTLLSIGYSAEQAIRLVSAIQVPDSRLKHEEAGGIKVVQAMSKGQSCVSSCRTFDYVGHEPGRKTVVLTMDDAYDRKTSIEYIGWIYDVDYEFLANDDVVQVIATGPRCYDHKVRLLLAGVPEERISCVPDEMDFLSAIRLEDTEAVYFLYDTSTHTLSCRMKDALIGVLEGQS